MDSAVDIQITIDDPAKQRGEIQTTGEKAIHVRLGTWHFVFACAKTED